MRWLLLTVLIVSSSLLLGDGDPISDVQVVTVDIPPSGNVTSLADANYLIIEGLSPEAEIVSISTGWRIVDRRGDWALAYGPGEDSKVSIKFTSLDPNWQVAVSGYKGRSREPIWTTGPLTRNSKGIGVAVLKWDDAEAGIKKQPGIF